MLKSGIKITLRLEPAGIYLNDGVFIPAGNISIGETHRKYNFSSQCWANTLVTQFEGGVLECELIGCSTKRPRLFYAPEVGAGLVRRLILAGANKSGLNMLCSDSRSQPIRRDNGVKKDLGVDALIASPDETVNFEPPEHPILKHHEEFRFHFDDMRIIDGAALFSADFCIPNFRWVSVELRVENDFLSEGFNYIKPYIARRLGRHTAKVSAVIQTQGPEVISVQATAPVVLKITSDLIIQVKHAYIRRKLRNAAVDKELVTVDQLFDEDDVEKSGLKPDDAQFVEDILSIKKPKHGDHIRYLSARHLHRVMLLRVLKKPFAFLFLIAGKDGCFLVLETLNSKEATYLWELNATESELRKDPDLFRKKYEWVEQEISVIGSEGRDAYRKDKPDLFHPIWHEYEREDGLAIWKDRLQAVLSGESV